MKNIFYQAYGRFGKKVYIDGLFVIVAMILAVFLEWTWDKVGIFSLVIWLILNPVSSKKMALITSASFMVTVALQGLRREPRAMEMASITFVLLLMTALSTVWEQKSSKTSQSISA